GEREGHLSHLNSAMQHLIERTRTGKKVNCPIVAFYSAGRAWTKPDELARAQKVPNGVRRWDAYIDCLREPIDFDDLQTWNLRETTDAVNGGGRMRPGFEADKRAVLECVPGGDAIWFDPERSEIVLSIDGNAQPFSNHSAGQRMMLA